MKRPPVLFVSHGAPTFALEPGLLGPQLRQLGAGLDDVKAVLVVSPHWQTVGVRVMAGPQPATVHDFQGFPEPLYRLRYPAPGAPQLAQDAARVLAGAGYAVALDERRGYDHGAWVPMTYLLPDARLPVFQVSLPHDAGPQDALRLGRTLAALRDRGVMIVGSGSLTHNLYEFRGSTDEAPYAREFAHWARDAVLAGDTARLADYRAQAPHAERAHPSEEHFLPLLIAAGAAAADDVPSLIDGGITYGVLSMDSFLWRPAAGA